ncbi:MAG: hypothetical protein R6U65_05165 [Perlabentimonas sp.]
MNKKKLVISYKNLSPELTKMLKNRYPFGYQDHVIKVTKPNGDYFYAVTLDTEDASYLVKVNVKIDTGPKDEDDEKGFFSDSDSIGNENDTFPDSIEEDDDYSDD